MKFLCLKCSQGMSLMSTELNAAQGSFSICYQCPTCDNQIAMLTNRGETQFLSSLGVSLQPVAGAASSEETSKCPFAAMLQSGAAVEQPSMATSTAPEQQVSATGFSWAREAEERLLRVPEFVRPMARSGIEQYAREQGYQLVSIAVMDEAKAKFGF